MTAVRIAVLDYGIGNLRSAQKALEKVGADARLTTDRGFVDDADAVVLPGVGAFGACMQALRSSRLDDVAVSAAASGRPFLGICVGMQMLYEGSDESPDVPGLALLPGRVRLLAGDVKRPQMQWNRLIARRALDPLLEGLTRNAWMYFVHSYATDDMSHAIATCDYGGPVVAAVGRLNVWATQFHPEKSGRDGLHLLRNFVTIAQRARDHVAAASS
ncbi:MAG TPA: imidazole glycerol phosphate synthase subunit HisH [Acidimicrobiales bacterium]|nr:imidazole glycerol phosphate synthase subunit HisH [Acidimicrobiales bacterium]